MNLPEIYPRATAKYLARDRYGNVLTDPIGVIFHVQVGNGSLFHEFSTSAQKKSSHLWIPKQGRPEQYVKLDRIAYAQAAGNLDWVSVEFEGYPEEPYTDNQINEAALFYIWCLETMAWPIEISDHPFQSGIGTHYMGGQSWGGHSCPGPIRAGQRHDIIDRVKEITMARIAEDEYERLFTGIAWIVGAVTPDAVWKDEVVQITNEHPVRQPDMRHVVEQAYLKGGDLQSKVDKLTKLLTAMGQEMGIDVSSIMDS